MCSPCEAGNKSKKQKARVQKTGVAMKEREEVFLASGDSDEQVGG